jgi:hypothetical protein
VPFAPLVEALRCMPVEEVPEGLRDLVGAGVTSNESRTTIAQTLGDGVPVWALFIKTPYGAGILNGYGYLVPESQLP